MKSSMWKIQLSTATIVLIPTAIAINYVGKTLATALRLPLWLDSIGTILAAIIGGPIVGALSGAVNNIIYSFQDPIAFPYMLTSAALGLTAGILAKASRSFTWKKACVSGLVVAFVAIVVSTPLNILLFGGQTGNTYGDTVFGILLHQGVPRWIASFVDEMLIDIPDKFLTVFLAYIIYRALPPKLIVFFDTQQVIESLDTSNHEDTSS